MSSGFLGLPAAEAFVRAGHIVYGTTRSTRSAVDVLAAREIVPIVVDPFDENGKKQWGKIAAEVDVVIDALSATGAKAALDTFNNYLEYIERPKGSPKSTYVYTSGLWINARGPGGLDKWTDERQPVSKYNKAVQFRPEIEIPVLENDKVNGIVIRPAIVYGRSGSVVASYVFDEALKGQKAEDGIWETIYTDESRYTSIHTDDAADLYLRVAERATILGGQVFLAANQATERLTDVLDAVVRVSGTKGYKSKPPAGDFDQAYLSSSLLKPSLGYALTGWTPRKMSLVDGMDIYWSAYLASKGELKI
uniref:NAD-dependent epimerase/dehydratase domain-containing protein n=1 Tax=Kwoniella pini CBS 10737 TaxID=1296096 RepID=A0A1B9HV81_9TREE|nr:uncharacterized protein I206_06951 [Kwoniella pini CBS 10737]OCF47173.1 hypothetical protein I206_06951 [Kwoniella pini CBS 10737]